MKRFQFYVILALVVLLMAAVIFWHSAQNTAHSTSTNTNIKVQALAGSEPSASSNKVTKEPSEVGGPPIDRLAEMGITPDMTQAQKEEKFREWYISQAAKITAQHQHLIEFYCETVDESNQPVAGVNAHLILTESPATPNGIVETNIQSDTQGFMSFSDAVGKLLQVWLSKDGYYVSKSNRIDFDYTDYQPNPMRPEMFHLRKKGNGTELITSRFGVYPELEFSVPSDGTPVHVDFFNRKVGGEGQMDLSATKPARGETASEWSFRLTIPNGGLIKNDDEFPFEAPEFGYQSTIEFRFKSDDPNWGKPLRGQFYIVFGQPPKYGRINIETAVDRGVYLGYVINPNGSRYLEPKDETYARPQ
jgi:hypothetical protein